MSEQPRPFYAEGFVPTPDQRIVIEKHDGDVQVVACAGSGKTESISLRVAKIIQEGGKPEEIVAFTFTEKAAAELKDRIARHVTRVIGADAAGILGRMFVGTIHAYCFRVLSEHNLEVGNYDVLDENTHAAFVQRERWSIGWAEVVDAQLGKPQYGYRGVELFISAVDAIGNELIPDAAIQPPTFAEAYRKYCDKLNEHKFLTFGLIISRTVQLLEQSPEFRLRIRKHLRHLLVDEYQDVNPAQERLIELLADNPRKGENKVNLCVVGDDDQAIYQWRGSDVGNILNFAKRRKALGRKVTIAKLVDNRRSLSPIVAAANKFAQSIVGRLDKEMNPVRKPSKESAVVCWQADTPADEAKRLAQHVVELRKKGLRYADIAILLRSVKSSAGVIAAALEEQGVPVSFGGRAGLFSRPEVEAMGMAFAWVAGSKWPFTETDDDEESKPKVVWREIALDDVIERLEEGLELKAAKVKEVRDVLESWKTYRTSSAGIKKVSLVGDFYMLLNHLDVWELDPDSDAEASRQLGAFGVFSQILADYEKIAMRGRIGRSKDNPEIRFIDGWPYDADSRGFFWRGLSSYLSSYARESYSGFAGEVELGRDEVQILTVHQSKGLEWPVVFLPGLSARRFPSSNTGKQQDWLLSPDCFDQARRTRYQGSDNDERRLFYVAMTRARDGLYLSTFRQITKKTKPSPYLEEVAGGPKGYFAGSKLPLPAIHAGKVAQAETPQLSFSDVASHDDCGYRYRLSTIFGFKPPIAQELGYGKAVHHVLRALAEHTIAKKRVPSEAEIKEIVQREMYVPYAPKFAFENMKQRAHQVALAYVKKHADDLRRVWAAERPFEIRADKAVVSGRADVILDNEAGSSGSLAIVDYKISANDGRDERYTHQLQVYAHAGRAEGLNVTALYLHPVKTNERKVVPSAAKDVAGAFDWLNKTVTQIVEGVYPAKAEAGKCARCDCRWVCKSRKCTL